MIHVRHAQLGLEVALAAKPLHDDIGTEALSEVHDQFSELHHRDVAEMAGRFDDHRDALVI